MHIKQPNTCVWLLYVMQQNDSVLSATALFTAPVLKALNSQTLELPSTAEMMTRSQLSTC